MNVRVAARAVVTAVCGVLLAAAAATPSGAATTDPPQAWIGGNENYNYDETGEYTVRVDCSGSIVRIPCETLTIERSDDDGTTWITEATLSNVDDTEFTATIGAPGATTMWRAQSTMNGAVGPWSETYAITAPLAPGKPKITRITIPQFRSGAWLCWQDAPENIGQATIVGYRLTLRAGGRLYKVQPRFTVTDRADRCGEVVPVGSVGLKQALSGNKLKASVAPLTNVTRNGEVAAVKKVRADKAARQVGRTL